MNGKVRAGLKVHRLRSDGRTVCGKIAQPPKVQSAVTCQSCLNCK